MSLRGLSLLNQAVGFDVISADDRGGRDVLSKSITEIFRAGNHFISCGGIAKAFVQASMTVNGRSFQEYILPLPIQSSLRKSEGWSKSIMLLAIVEFAIFL